jgi:hypothetical protein
MKMSSGLLRRVISLMTEAVSTSETSAIFYETTWPTTAQNTTIFFLIRVSYSNKQLLLNVNHPDNVKRRTGIIDLLIIFLHSPVNPTLLRPNIIVSFLFSNILCS